MCSWENGRQAAVPLPDQSSRVTRCRLGPLLAVGATFGGALAFPPAAAAHGIGSIKDLPVPAWLFLFGGVVVLIVSFVALAVLWTKPQLDESYNMRPLPGRLQAVVLSRALRLVLGAASFFLLTLAFATAAFGDPAPLENFAPTFVYVIFWLGLVAVVVVLGNVWQVLNPWRAAADFAAWLASKAGGQWNADISYPERWGRWPAAVLLFAFATLELAYFDPANPRILAIAMLLYSWITWLGMAIFGRSAWLQNGDGFSVYFSLFSRLSPFARRDTPSGPRLFVRRPLSGLSARDAVPGTLAVIAVMLGSVAFDGFSRSTWWVERRADVMSPFFLEHRRLSDLAGMGLNILGLLTAVMIVAVAYRAAVWAAQSAVSVRLGLASVFLSSLIPIALVYAVAHYLTLFLVQGQFMIPLISDPFGENWNLFGTASYQPDLNVLTPNQIWYAQVAILVVGHVVGLMVAHDRAVALVESSRTAARTQYAMLALMVLYTVGGMWLLSLT